MSDRRTWLLRALPRLAILVTAFAELASGDYAYGTFCIVALVLTLIPAIQARRLDAGVPIDLELVLLWFMVTDMTLGNGMGLYHLAWYDKALHLGSSVLIAMIGFLAIYVLHLTHHTRFHPWIDGIAILLVTLGVGALWEIGEYGVDQLLGRHTQWSPTLGPIDDTMFDLMMDGLGGVVGAILGPLYIRHSRRSRNVVRAFARLMNESSGARTQNESPSSGTRTQHSTTLAASA